MEDGTACRDTEPCTVGEFCRGGVCGVPVVCDDQNPCTVDWCNRATGECRFEPTVCNDGDPCTADVCDPRAGGCIFLPRTGQACDDLDPCTVGDVCVQGPFGGPVVCQGTPQTCNDGDPCTLDVCDPNTGQCLSSPLVCDDGNRCTRDFCDTAAGGCVFAPLVGQPCDDGDFCTTGDVCREIVGGPVVCIGVPVTCDDNNLCTMDRCDPATGQCQSLPVLCSDENMCTADACDPATGQCVFTPIPLMEVEFVRATGAVTLQWTTTADATHWNTYRGTIPAMLLGSRLPGSVYDHVCFESDDAAGDGATTAMDPSVPPVGTAYYYDITGEGTCGEGPLGSAFPSGIIRPNPFPCLTPP